MGKGWFCLLGILLPLVAAAKAPSQPIERYAFIAASNDGGVGRAKLRYAESDALSLANVFEEIGGINNANRAILLSPTRSQFVDSLRQFGEKIMRRSSDVKNTQLLFYYSGHSNEKGLLLGDGLVTYRDLRKALDDIPVDVRVAILDSCQAGAFTRPKGGQRKPSFLVDESKNIKGTVMLAASSENEAAQESDKIGASFFTHYLVSALRGAGDVSGDKLVTLNEAYFYAFNETLARTEGSKQGAQHPAYDIQIAGAGDLVLTDVSQTSATLVVPADIIGRLYIRDPSGRLVVELNKLVNNEIELALMPGLHQVLLDQEGGIFKQDVMIARSSHVVLGSADFVTVVAQTNRVRGSGWPEKQAFNIDWGLENPNRLAVGYATDFVEIYGPFGDFAGEVSADFKGYAVNYRRDIRRDLAVQLAFSEAKATGVLRNFSISALTSILGSDMNQRNGLRAYGGLGVLAFRLFYFPPELMEIYRGADIVSDEYHYGVQGALGLQAEFGQLTFDSAAIFRLANVSRQKPLENGGRPVYTAQVGFRF